MIRRQLAQLVRLVDDLLDVSRITSGKLVVRKQPAELAAIMASAVETARPLLDQRRQALTVDLPRPSVRLQGDSVRLAQVFANLLNNAAKYSEPGRSIAVTAEVKDGRAIVRIADQGAGIAPEALAAIFEMFTQVEPSSAAQSGLGVGLALARRLVELHGGTIVAESPGKGHGSVFTVALPVDPAPATEPEPARAAPPSGRRRVLLVDDNVDFVTSMSMLLTSLGHDVRVAHDAAGALAVARDLRPDIGFLDLGLPGISGYELATQLHAQNASTVLVAVSGWGQPRDRERSRAAGFALHLVKPVELRSIEAAIATLTPEREHV
jgi:CheY-like chemotaxis protein/anti-sigma regulatory factor (Ser/Thr protein kinase)